MVANLSSGTKGKRKVKNLECSVNYDARGSSLVVAIGRGGVPKLSHEARIIRGMLNG